MTESLELACFISCEGGLEIDNADLVIAYVEHMDDSIEVKGATVQIRISNERLERAVANVLKSREKDRV